MLVSLFSVLILLCIMYIRVGLVCAVGVNAMYLFFLGRSYLCFGDQLFWPNRGFHLKLVKATSDEWMANFTE